jgi:hypothetical protein
MVNSAFALAACGASFGSKDINLPRFLNSTLETALIIEDDSDWDIRLRSVQIPLAAGAARTALPPKRVSNPFARHHVSRMYYWGDHGEWDLLYIGHCGDYCTQGPGTMWGFCPKVQPSEMLLR